MHPTRNSWKKALVLLNWKEENSFSSIFADLLYIYKYMCVYTYIWKIIDTAFLFSSLCVWSTQPAVCM